MASDGMEGGLKGRTFFVVDLVVLGVSDTLSQ